MALSGELRDMLAANAQDAEQPLRFSHIRQMGRSPAHCLHALKNDWEPTLSMRLGSATHSLLLGGPPLCRYPGKVRRGKDYDAWFAEQPTGCIVVNAKEEGRAQAMDAAVRAHEAASRVLFQPDTLFEKTIYWEWMGQKFRSTPDARTKGHLVDLKTTRDATPDRFQYDARRSAYHAQLYTYSKAMEAENGYAPKSVYLVSVESSPPHAVVVHELTLRALDEGGKLARGWLERLIECKASGVWGGYDDGVVEFDVPFDMDSLVFEDDDDSTTEGDE